MLRFVCALFVFFLITPSLLICKVYDCFPFYNELELLKIRLDELNSVVDYFVLVESRETQRGNVKNLYFDENKGQFAAYAHKIIHIIVDERHPEFGLWERENYQRNCILRGLNNCHEKDIILISDLDEIPRPYFVERIKENFKRRKLNTIAFEMQLYRFQLNRMAYAAEPWVGTVATTFKELSAHNPQYFRDKRGSFFRFKNGGWHFTWMGGRDYIRTKMRSVVEGTDDTTLLTDEAVDQWINSVPVVPVDWTFPLYVQRHQAELKALGYLADY
jgi:hypothetical protein